MRTICPGSAGVDEAAEVREAQKDHEICQLTYMFFRSLKETVCNNTLYREDDSNGQNCRALRTLRRAYVDRLPFVVVEMEDDLMTKLNIQNPVALSLEVLNMEDVGTNCVRASSLNAQKASMNHKHTFQPVLFYSFRRHNPGWCSLRLTSKVKIHFSSSLNETSGTIFTQGEKSSTSAM